VTVTRIEPLGKNRSRIYLDERPAFVLYRGEISRYEIREGFELPEESYREIMEELLIKRAKLRCMNLLKSMDRTEFQLRQKLAMGDYPAEIIDQALAYVKGFGYVNDESYAERYIELRRERDSRMQITHALMQKGISKDVIQAIFEEQEPADEEEMIRRWMEKKHFDPETASAKEKQKMYMFLMRKGFSASEISRAFHSEK
jgi:regulatory protein